MSVKFRNSDGTTQLGYIDLVNINMTVMNQQNGNLIFGTNNGEDMRILTNGNVGIGTQTPAFPLDVNGNARIGGTMYSQSTPGVWFVNGGVSSGLAGIVPLLRTTNDASALYSTGVLPPASGTTAVQGTFTTVNVTNDDGYIIMPGYGITGYQSTGLTGTININVYNNTNNARYVTPASLNALRSFRLFYQGVQID